MLQVKLLTTEEKYRSNVLYQQIKAFEDKIYTCDEMFSTDLLHKMFKELSKRTKVSSDICTIQGIRHAFRTEARRLAMRNRTRKPGFSNKTEPDQMMQYFAWFFNYIKYLRELRSNFVERIFNPLFKYFYETGSDGPDKEKSVDSSMSVSNMSLHSYRSSDTNASKLSQMTRYSSTSDISGISEMTISSMSSLGMSADNDMATDDIHVTRQKMLSRAALHLLGREFRDIRQLYDSTDIENIAQRLSILKEQVDYLLDSEDKITFDMFGQDSETAVHHLKLKHMKVHCLLRLLPDVVVKCKKAAWLAKRWLQIDDAKTKDLNRKMNKLASIEGQLSRRLLVLSKDIQKHEHQLEQQLSELNNLMKREERSNDLHVAFLETEDKEVKVTADFEKLQREKIELTKHLKLAITQGKHSECKHLRTMYERNKLQRYALKRQLATLSYHRTLVDRDMTFELDAKPNMIHFTNDVQDRCEELEKLLEKERSEKKTIEAALLPIVEDRGSVTDRLRGSQMNSPVRGANQTPYVDSNTPRNSDLFIHIDNKLTSIEPQSEDEDVFDELNSGVLSPRTRAMYMRTLKNSSKFNLAVRPGAEITNNWS